MNNYKKLRINLLLIISLMILIPMLNVNAQSKKVKDLLDDVNEWCEKYDLYKRVFSYNESTQILTMVSEYCTVEIPADKIASIYTRPSEENYQVVFSTKGHEEVIDVQCTSFDEMDSVTAITMSDKKYAQKVSANLNKLLKITSGGKGSTASKGSKGSDKLLKEINDLCAKYDKYHRVFTIENKTDMLVFTSKSCVVKLPFRKIGEVAVKELSGGSFSLQFKSKNEEKCFDVKCTSFSEMNGLTSLTFTDKNGAEQAAAKLRELISNHQ